MAIVPQLRGFGKRSTAPAMASGDHDSRSLLLSRKGTLCGMPSPQSAQDAASISPKAPAAACRRAIADPVSRVFSKCRQHARHLGRGDEGHFSGEKMPLECRMHLNGAGEMPRVCKGNPTPGHEDRGREVSDGW